MIAVNSIFEDAMEYIFRLSGEDSKSKDVNSIGCIKKVEISISLMSSVMEGGNSTYIASVLGEKIVVVDVKDDERTINFEPTFNNLKATS